MELPRDGVPGQCSKDSASQSPFSWIRFPCPPTPASSRWGWSLTSPNPQILSHLSSPTCLSHSSCFARDFPGSGSSWKTPSKGKKKKKKRRGELLQAKGAGEKRGHTGGHFTPALLCLSSFHTGKSSGKTPPLPDLSICGIARGKLLWAALP